MRASFLLAMSSLLIVSPALAETPSYEIILKDHAFTPAELTIPADTKVKLVVKNLDSTPAEFESDDFKREKIIPGGKSATISVGPLKTGTYKFFDEFNEATAQGVLIVK